MQIVPLKLDNLYRYYTGVFDVERDKNLITKKLVPVKYSPYGTKIEDYFVLLISALNSRGNWQHISEQDAISNSTIDLSWTNTSLISGKSSIQYRLLLDTPYNFISMKSYFYDKFKDYSFIPKFKKITRDNIYKKLT